MRKFYSALSSVLMLCVFAGQSQAQTAIINTGTAGTPAYNAGPIYRSSASSAYDASRYTYLYTASELSAAGITSGSVINLLGWVKNNNATTTGGGIFRIYMKNSSAAAFSNATETWANLNSGATLVYENLNQNIPATTTPTYIDFTLATPFTYTGGSLEISTEWDINQVSGNPTTGTLDWLWSTVPDRIYGTGNTTLAGTATLSSTTNSISTIDDRRPFIKIGYGAATPCTEPPVPGTLSSTATNVCLGVPFTLTSTGGTNGSGQILQWQSSPDNISFSNIAGANTGSYTTTQSASTYYRLMVTCGASSVPSASILVTTTAAVSGTFTINSNLPTGGTNFQTFNAAYDYIKCGINGPVIFNVDAASGPYNEQLIMNAVPGASAANTVTFNGNGRTLSFLSTATGQRAVIKLDGADHIRFNDLVINATGTATTEYGFGVQLINNADSNQVNNCAININTSSTSTNYAGIVISASHTSATTTGSTLSDGNIFYNNNITGGYYGITLVGSNTEACQNNQFTSNKITEFYFYGMYVSGTFNTLIDSNRINRPTRATVSTFNGIYFTGLSVSANVTRNTITNPFGGAPTSTSLTHGIYFTGVDALAGLNNIVSNNLLYDFSGAGEINAFNNTSSDNVLYYHNTVSLDGPGGTALAKAFYQTTLAGGIEFIDNIVSISRGGTGAKYALYYNTITSDINSNRNDLYIAPSASNAFTGFYTSAQATLANWQAASGDDANSEATNPIFANVGSGVYQPTNASINNLGVPVGVAIDILGVARNASTPDMGAYEFTPGACVAPPTGGSSLVSMTPVCVNTSVQLSLSGNSIGSGQTYQWQSSSSLAGPYTTIGNVLTNPDTTILASTSLYYRTAVTCGGNTVYSTPVLLTVNPALAAGTYTINAGALPSATNYTSFNAAKAAMLCGIAGPVVFNVVAGSGPYNEQLVLDAIAGTSAVNTVSFNGNGETIAFSSSNTNDRAVIKLRNADHIIFDSLVIDAKGAGTYGYGVQLFNDADSNTITRCQVKANTGTTSTNFAGIVVNASEAGATTTGNTLCDGNTFSYNTINGGYYGITLVGSTTSSVANNKIIGNKIEDHYLYGIYLYGNFNSLVEGNDISRPVRSDLSTFYGIYVSSLNVGMNISKNRIHNPFNSAPASTSAFYGIYFTGVDAIAGAENKVFNNLIYNVNGEGTSYGIYNTSSDNVWYFHNTISLDNVSSTSANNTYGFYQTTQAGGIELKNNLFSISRGGSGDKYGMYFATSTTSWVSDYNDFFLNGANTFVGYNGADRINLSAWQAASGQDLNSVSINPYFASVATGNFKPQSPALDNKGTPVGINSDILDQPRSTTTPDIGAYEFAVPPCTAPPLAGSAMANPSSGICLGAQISLSLSGYTFGSGQTYQWQYSPTAVGSYTNLGGLMQFPDTVISATTTLYYRVAVTCGTNTSYSTPVQVAINPAFLAGTYTINSTIPPSSTNFQSFAAAVSALDCGITGPVYFDVAPNTYTEQIRMHSIAGTSPSVRVTFRSANGNPASVILTNDATVAANNYTLKLDSASYITYKNMTITATNATNGRVVELANTASQDSIVNCILTAPVSTITGNATAGIYADMLRGSHNVIKGNTISNGASGIYLEGSAINNLTFDNVIDSNTVNGSYNYNIYLGFNGRATVTKNKVEVSGTRAATSYGIYSTNSDSAYIYKGNEVNITNTTTTVYGMYFTAATSTAAEPGIVANNTILATTGNTGTLYGMYQTGSEYNKNLNNVISINTSGATSYGLYSTGGGGGKYYNNTVVSNATSATTNVAAYFAQTSGADPSVNIRNNIFSHLGGGRAMYVTNLNFIYSDYNTFFTTGPTLIQWNAGNQYATLQQWRDTSYWDLNSIVYQPALMSPTDLHPNLASPEVWAIHGRGVQIADNNYDFNNNPRPTTLTTGVPDMGAFEFLPTSQPTLLTAIPATPAAGITQTFMYGTDTVTKITYAAGAPVPASIGLRRYSGVLPPGLGAGQQSMYYYTQLEVPTQGAYNYDIKQYYIDPWQGFIPNELATKMGRTNAANAWQVNSASTVDHFSNVITDTSTIPYIGRYTGMTDGTVPPPPSITYPVDSSNRGTRFWVAYGHHYGFSTNSQDMVLYLSAEQAANVQVRVNGTSWVRNYTVGANSVKVSDPMPKYGLVDSRITDEGFSDKGISITSDVPIVAYAHIFDGSNSGAGMLLPVGVYGYEYQSLNSRQYYPTGGAGSYSWFYVIADRDSSVVEITPSVATKGGHPAGVPFVVRLNKGEVYNVMGTISGADGTDLSGSKVRSIANAQGECKPIAVFSGSSRTALCNTTNGDNFIQQVFPSQAWGTKYLTFATANSTSNTNYNSNIFRVMVKDPTTVVKKNGTTLNPATLVIPGNYYEFSTTQGTLANGAIYVEADKPVMMAQYMVSTGANSCPGVTATGNGDPEMIYISPIEQGIKKAVFYNTTESAITSNYINVVIPTAGLSSLTIDGVSTFTDVVAHPFLPGYTAIRHNLGAAAGQHIIQSDSAFTAITYGLGSVESYGYNAGTLVKNLNGVPSFTNVLGTGGNSDHTCVKAPFRFSVMVPLKPTSILWELSQVPNLTPNTDSLQNNPVPVDSVFINGRMHYRYTLVQDFKFTASGTYNVPITITHPSLEGCSNSQQTTLTIRVIPAPVADFTTVFSGCFGTPVQFNGTGTTANGVGINTWSWTFGDNTNGSGQSTTHSYAAPGTYNVNLSLVAADGCLADTTKPVSVNALPAVAVVNDSLVVCGNSPVTFAAQNPVAGTTYGWYPTPTGGSPVFTGPSYTVPNVTGTVVFYVQATNASGCISSRKRVVASVLPDLAVPVAAVDSAGTDRIVFKWNAVPNALTYEVSIDNGNTWITPSSGATGLTHTVTGLMPLQSVTLIVRAHGGVSCQVATSAAVTGRTLPDQIYIPNAFSPNGDGLNDILLVYGYTIQNMRFMVFNQWGEKIFESNNQATGWNGMYKGKPQPSGVYMYVCQITLRDGTTQVKKGSINLVR